MKKIIVYLLCYSLLISGCYSMNSTQWNSSRKLPEDYETINLKLIDGTDLDLEPGSHVNLLMPDSIFYAKVYKYYNETNISYEVISKIFKSSDVDSIENNTENGNKMILHYQNGKSKYLIISIYQKIENITGFWILKSSTVNGGKNYMLKNQQDQTQEVSTIVYSLMKIQQDQIQEVSVKEYSPTKTNLVKVTILVAIAIALFQGLKSGMKGMF